MENFSRESAGGGPPLRTFRGPQWTDGLVEYAPTWRLTVDKESRGSEKDVL